MSKIQCNLLIFLFKQIFSLITLVFEHLEKKTSTTKSLPDFTLKEANDQFTRFIIYSRGLRKSTIVLFDNKFLTLYQFY